MGYSEAPLKCIPNTKCDNNKHQGHATAAQPKHSNPPAIRYKQPHHPDGARTCPLSHNSIYALNRVNKHRDIHVSRFEPQHIQNDGSFVPREACNTKGTDLGATAQTLQTGSHLPALLLWDHKKIPLVFLIPNRRAKHVESRAGNFRDLQGSGQTCNCLHIRTAGF